MRFQSMHVSHARAAVSLGMLWLGLLGLITDDGSGWLEPNPQGPVQAAVVGSGWMHPDAHVTSPPPVAAAPFSTSFPVAFPARPLPSELTRPPAASELPRPAPAPVPAKPAPAKSATKTVTRKQVSGEDYPTGWGWWPILYNDSTRATVYGYSDGKGRVILE